MIDDKDDSKFAELAVEAQASHLITGNSNDFVIKDYRGILI
jgi:predicted nucleic acid-binding protein